MTGKRRTRGQQRQMRRQLVKAQQQTAPVPVVKKS